MRDTVRSYDRDAAAYVAGTADIAGKRGESWLEVSAVRGSVTR